MHRKYTPRDCVVELVVDPEPSVVVGVAISPFISRIEPSKRKKKAYRETLWMKRSWKLWNIQDSL